MELNKSKRAMSHMKAWGMFKRPRTRIEPIKPVKRLTDSTQSHVEFNQILADVKKQLRRKK